MFAILWLAWTVFVPLGLGFFSLLIIFGTGVGLMLALVRMIKQIRMNILANSALKMVAIGSPAAVFVLDRLLCQPGASAGAGSFARSNGLCRQASDLFDG